LPVGSTIREADKKVTDIHKAYLAHTGQSRDLIIRPFSQLIDEDGVAIDKLSQTDMNKLIEATNPARGL
jgi:hypothetical protein